MKVKEKMYDLINRSMHYSEEGRLAEANLNLIVVKELIDKYLKDNIEITNEQIKETFVNVKEYLK